MLERVEAFTSRTAAPALPLVSSSAGGDPIQIRNIDGLGPVKAAINTSQYAEGPGESTIGTSIGKRNIVLTLGLNPDWSIQTMESLRQLLYTYFMTSQWVKLRFYRTPLSTVEISGTVESFEPMIFSKDPEIQISIICTDPDFVDVDITSVSGVVGPGDFTIEYNGTVDTGFELQIDPSVAAPIFVGAISLMKKTPVPLPFYVDGVFVDGSNFFKMSSVFGKRYIQIVETVGGVVTNKLGRMTAGSVWPELQPGDNVLSIEAVTSSGQNWTIRYHARYGAL